MAYRCPVCDALQPDGEHLANHLAITAMLDREDHAAWLEAHAPKYGDMGPSDLAETITPHVERVEIDDEEAPDSQGPPDSPPGMGGAETEPFEHAIDRQSGHGRTAGVGASSKLDAETRAVLEEARELTASMQEDDGDDADEDDDAEESS